MFGRRLGVLNSGRKRKEKCVMMIIACVNFYCQGALKIYFSVDKRFLLIFISKFPQFFGPDHLILPFYWQSHLVILISTRHRRTIDTV